MYGKWAFVRATEVVELDKGELQETDLTVASLLELPKKSNILAWRIVELWTLPDDRRSPYASFVRGVRERVKREGIPTGFLPGDL